MSTQQKTPLCSFTSGVFVVFLDPQHGPFTPRLVQYISSEIKYFQINKINCRPLRCRIPSTFVGKRCLLTTRSWLFLKSEKLSARKWIKSKPNFGPIMVSSHFFFVLFTALRSRVHGACQTPVYKRGWPLPRLCIVAQSLCDFHGKNLEVQSRGLDRIQLGSIGVTDDVILFLPDQLWIQICSGSEQL